MTVLNALVPASYKGVPFLVDGSTVQGGLKAVKHTFPNSDNQVIETLGTRQRTFQLRAFITGDETTYIQKRNDLIRVLETEGSGILVHPIYGSINNIISTQYTLSEDFGTLGEARFGITFEYDFTQSVPSLSTDNLVPRIATLSETVTTASSAGFLSVYSVAGLSAGDITDAINKGRDLVAAITEATEVFTQVTDQINSYASNLAAMSSDIVNLVQQPVAFFDSFNTLIAGVVGLYVTAQESFDVLVGLFGFGDDDLTLPNTTQSYINRTTNRDAVNEAVQILSLSNAYLIATEISLQSVAQQDAILQTLEIQFQKLYDSTTVDTDTKLALQDLRQVSQENFDNQRNAAQAGLGSVSLLQTTPIFTFTTSARLLAYQYYGSADQGEDIVLLNDLHDASFVSGDLEIFTA